MKIFRFDGKEITDLKEKGFIEIQELNGEELSSFLEYLYTKTIKTNDLKVLFPLLNFANMYFEEELKIYVMLAIAHKTGNWLKNKNRTEFREFLFSFGYLLETKIKPIQDLILFWKSFNLYSENEINSFILISLESQTNGREGKYTE